MFYGLNNDTVVEQRFDTQYTPLSAGCMDPFPSERPADGEQRMGMPSAPIFFEAALMEAPHTCATATTTVPTPFEVAMGVPLFLRTTLWRADVYSPLS